MATTALNIDTGAVTFDVNNTGRTITFNPTDAGYAQRLYDLVTRLQDISNSEADDDTASVFQRMIHTDTRMREEVDSFFGDGFCHDVFGSTRLMALAGGLTLIEQLLYAIIDQMDDSITTSGDERKKKLEKYTKKYSKYTQKK